MKQYIVTGMSCAACQARVEKAVSGVPGVTAVSVSLLTNSMGVEGTAAPEEILREKSKSAGLLPDRMILFARKFYPTKTLERTVDVMLGGLEL